MDKKVLGDILSFIYGTEQGGAILPRLLALLDAYPRGLPPFEEARKTGGSPHTAHASRNDAAPAGRGLVDHRDALLISYADMLAPPAGGDGESGLSRLGKFLAARNGGAFSYLHLLPFHPYSSDDGFSVIDYSRVDDRFGSWEDLERLKTISTGSGRLVLAFDLVVNHGSVQSEWFKGFLAGKSEYSSWYLTRPKTYDSGAVFRPRTHPLLSEFKRAGSSPVYVWTTFSADQADYDFSHADVLLEFVKILLQYARRGAGIVRLDAIAYLWKEDGTACLHHPKTHAVVRLFRAVIDYLGLPLLILTETNVPHAENISYFGTASGPAEAHMVYNFALPPLVLHACVSGDAGPLREWAKTLPLRAEGRYFLNFLASHDGVGLTPAAGLVDEKALAATIETARRRGALVSYKSTPRGEVPYELNCSFASVIAPRELGSAGLRAKAFLAAHAAMLFLSGLPAVYFHSWIGSEAWTEGPALLGYKRAINRERPPVDRVEAELAAASFRRRVYEGFQKMLAIRKAEALFDPEAEQRVLEAAGGVFALERRKNRRRMVCLVNLGRRAARWTDPESGGRFALGPFEARIVKFAP